MKKDENFICSCNKLLFNLKINLRVRTDNKRAILLYERRGFVKEAKIRKEIFIDGQFYDHYWMSLELDES